MSRRRLWSSRTPCERERRAPRATFGAILWPCLKPAAIADALSGVNAEASAAMTAAVWAKSSLGNVGRGPAPTGASTPVAPPTRSSSAFSLAEPKRGIWYSGRSHRTTPRASSLRSLFVEGDEARKHVFVSEIVGPAVGVGDGSVEFVVQLLQDQHEAVIEGAPFAVAQCIGTDASAEPLQHVVQPGQSEVRMVREHALAVCVQVFGDRANLLLLKSSAQGNGNGSKQRDFV